MFDYRPMFPELASIRRARETRVALEEAQAASKRRLNHYRDAVRQKLPELALTRYAHEATIAARVVAKLDAELFGQRVMVFD